MDRREGGQRATAPVVGTAWLGATTAVVLALFSAWPQAARLTGYEAVAPSRCASSPADDRGLAGRPGLDRALLPVGYRVSATTTAVVCRYDPHGRLESATGLDPARSARLAALLGAPAEGWPDDVLSAKSAPPLTDAQVARAARRAAAAPCAGDTTSTTVTFGYVEGPDAVVVVRGEPCATASNQAITVPAPPGVLAALDAVAALALR